MVPSNMVPISLKMVPRKELNFLTLRIQTPPDRIGFFGFQSHPQVIGLLGISPETLGDTNGSLGLFHLAMSNVRCNSRIATELEATNSRFPVLSRREAPVGSFPKMPENVHPGVVPWAVNSWRYMTPAGQSSLLKTASKDVTICYCFVENYCFLKMPSFFQRFQVLDFFCLS